MKALYDDKNKNKSSNRLAAVYIALFASACVAFVSGVLLFVYGLYSATKVFLFILTPLLFVPALILCFYDMVKRLSKTASVTFGCLYLILLYGIFAVLIITMVVYIIAMFALVALLGLGGFL